MYKKEIKTTVKIDIEVTEKENAGETMHIFVRPPFFKQKPVLDLNRLEKEIGQKVDEELGITDKDCCKCCKIC